jgi:DNA-binding LytR/AlgR family response regulator
VIRALIVDDEAPARARLETAAASTRMRWIIPTLNDLEQRLDPARFFRISRAALIQPQCRNEVFPLTGGSGEALKNRRLEVSRRRFRERS